MKAVVAAFNQEKALVGAFSVITNLRMAFVWISSLDWANVCLDIYFQLIFAPLLILQVYNLDVVVQIK